MKMVQKMTGASDAFMGSSEVVQTANAPIEFCICQIVVHSEAQCCHVPIILHVNPGFL